MNLQQLKKEQQSKVNTLITNSSMFFAFSNQQFAENKTPLLEGEKYVSLGAGAYIPKTKLSIYTEGMKEINKWFKSAVKDNKLRFQQIAYELSNHEAYYTGDISDTLEALGSDYTEAEVRDVYNKTYHLQEL